MSEGFIRTAWAKGLRESVVVGKHGRRAALTPILTTFGMDVGLPARRRAIFDRVDLSAAGVGQLTMLAIQNQDFPEIMGVLMLAALFNVIANMLVEILYAAVDPKVRTSLRASGSGTLRTLQARQNLGAFRGRSHVGQHLRRLRAPGRSEPQPEQAGGEGWLRPDEP